MLYTMERYYGWRIKTRSTVSGHMLETLEVFGYGWNHHEAQEGKGSLIARYTLIRVYSWHKPLRALVKENISFRLFHNQTCLCSDSFHFGCPGADNSQHTRLWRAVPAWHHSGHLHRPGVSDVRNTRLNLSSWRAEGHSSSLIHSPERSLRMCLTNPKYTEQLLFIVNTCAQC